MLSTLHRRLVPTGRIVGRLLSSQSSKTQLLAGTTVVNSKATANRALAELQRLSALGRSVAWDTEIACLLRHEETYKDLWDSVECSCASAFGGKDADFGNGPHLWIDNTSHKSLAYFAEYFASPSDAKIWHNYRFDARVLHVALSAKKKPFMSRGLGGDTMHMAKLWDSSRGHNLTRKGYSLRALTQDLLPTAKNTMQELFTNFEHPCRLLENPETRNTFINYSILDASLTHELHEVLCDKLAQQPWVMGNAIGNQELRKMGTMLDFYRQYWLPYGQLLVEMETRGIRLDRSQNKLAIEASWRDQEDHKIIFRQWSHANKNVVGNATEINFRSRQQKAFLLFAPTQCSKSTESWPATKTFTRFLWRADSMTITGLGLPVKKRTPLGWPACDTATITALLGRCGLPVEGNVCHNFLLSKGQDVEKATQTVEALRSLFEACSLSQLSSQMIALYDYDWPDETLKLQMQIETESGRLYTTSPNMANMLSRGYLRKALAAAEGNTFIVVEFANLDMRVFAHLSLAQNITKSIQDGDDWHDCTAAILFPEVELAVKNGTATVGYKEGVQTVEEAFPRQRLLAKILNQALTHGDDVASTAEQLGLEEAVVQNYFDLLHKKCPQIFAWRKQAIKFSSKQGFVSTLLGRRIMVPKTFSRRNFMRATAEKMATAKPIEGTAADVIMCAALALHANAKLDELGFKLVAQILDEIVLEGPESHAGAALEIVQQVVNTSFPIQSAQANFVATACVQGSLARQ